MSPEIEEEEGCVEIVGTVRSGSKIDAIEYPREKFKLDLLERQIIMANISDPWDHCADCRNNLLENEYPSYIWSNMNW